MTSWHITSSQHITSPPRNGWRLVHTKNSVWASHWLVPLRTFYRQILSLVHSFFPWKFHPWLALELLVIYVCIYIYVYVYMAQNHWLQKWIMRLQLILYGRLKNRETSVFLANTKVHLAWRWCWWWAAGYRSLDPGSIILHLTLETNLLWPFHSMLV